ncbi:MAG: hypothetical protein PHV82_06810 [Victivallaceae bacterium]|nr:hypothetical protein [Victivallaceae bacterium]
MQFNEQYRSTCWWLTWKDLAWPDEDVTDDIRRRADSAAQTGINCALIMGAHFRWDFMPLWMNLHDMISFIGDQLHQRNILLFDHHSAVLTHRYSNQEEAKAMRLYNRHHVSFAPSRDIASEWTYKGQKLDDWRMIDLVTGKPVFLNRYTAEQFCMNNPDFKNAYYDYVKKLLAETNIDGLMCDDGIFYSGWTSCGCKWCREKFRLEYGHELPAVTDTSFWGNYRNEGFKDWIEMRFKTTGEFLDGVRKVTGDDFHLMSCCSSSASAALPRHGMTYQEFIKPCNHIMLEMGFVPAPDGNWYRAFPEQMLHLGIGRENNAFCLGLGYGFTEPIADFVWAFNKFLGSGTWFSTVKGRLGLPDSKMLSLKDDTELCGNGFNWEKTHLSVFDAVPDSELAVFFSRWSRDFYSMTDKDYTDDYSATCLDLLENNLTFDVVTTIPQASEYRVLILSSASCLDETERSALNKYLKEGGIIIASGPLGCYDKRGNKTVKPWLEQFDITCKINEPERIASFPPGSKQEDIAPACNGTFKGAEVDNNEWIEIINNGGKLLWSPARIQNSAKDLALAEHIRRFMSEEIVFPADTGWKFRLFRKGSSRIIHGLAGNFVLTYMDELEKERKGNKERRLIDSIRKSKDVSSAFSLQLRADYKNINFYAPLTGVKKKIPVNNGLISIKLDEETYYFILEAESGSQN